MMNDKNAKYKTRWGELIFIIPIGTFNNLMRIHRQRSCQSRQLPPKKHLGYVICKIEGVNEPHSRVRIPIEKYGTWNIDKVKSFDDFNEKFKFLEKRKATSKDYKVECYKVDLQTPYANSLTVEDLYVIMLPELYEIILPLLGYENDSGLNQEEQFLMWSGKKLEKNLY